MSVANYIGPRMKGALVAFRDAFPVAAGSDLFTELLDAAREQQAERVAHVFERCEDFLDQAHTTAVNAIHHVREEAMK